jgi:hypothetical protein
MLKKYLSIGLKNMELFKYWHYWFKTNWFKYCGILTFQEETWTDENAPEQEVKKVEEEVIKPPEEPVLAEVCVLLIIILTKSDKQSIY